MYRHLTFALCALLTPHVPAQNLGLGRVPNAAHLATQDIAIAPGGDELPLGHGNATQGAQIFAQQCAACHGATGTEGPDPRLVGGLGTLATNSPLQTIGSYWPYPTTVFDYINRAMPFTSPGSLTPNEVYALTAFLLAANGIIDANEDLNRVSLPAVRMPNRDGFVNDPRPETR
jgi:cytochrome c